jgi:hypothetical protein
MRSTVHRKEEIIAQLKAMDSRYAGERQEAERAIQRLDPEGVELLLEIVRSEADRTRRRRRVYHILAVTFAAVGIPLLLFAIVMMLQAMAMGEQERAGMYGGMIGTIAGTIGGGVLGGFSFLLAPTARLQAASRALGQLDDVRAIGPILETISSRMIDFHTRYALVTALMQLLPSLQVGDRDLLTDRQLDSLYQCLRRSHLEKETDLVIACLDAIGKIGGSGALPHLERLVHIYGESENLDRVRQKAREIQEALTARIEQQRQGMSLLRPAESPDSPAETLLRPAQGAAPADPQVLLRASAQNETE